MSAGGERFLKFKKPIIHKEYKVSFKQFINMQEKKAEEINLEQEDIPTRAGKNRVFKSEKAKIVSERRDYIPIREPRNTVEIEAKPKPSREQIEIIEEKGSKTSRRNKRPKNEKLENQKEWDGKEKELSGSSILIITEKPQAASKIAAALSEGRARQIKSGAGIYHYEFSRDNENVIVACAVGHLFSLSQNIKGSDYPIFDISWKPNFEVRKKDFTKRYYDNLVKLIKRTREIIVATDYDVEGEVIGHNIVKFIAHQKDARRMKFSSLTAQELEEAYQHTLPTIDWGQALAGETRHYLDWYYGINLSRALMNAIKSTGKFKIMSIGRVQGPALKLIVDREKEINAFKSTPFWRVFILVSELKDKSNKLELQYIKDITDKKELDKFKILKGQHAEMDTKKTIQIIPPPAPFDLTTLQTESYKFFSITPARTLQIAQSLYLAGLISYPRTSSQKIPEAINPKAILKRLANNFPQQTKFASRNLPIEGAKSDPAHPSIYPTGEFQMLDGEEKKIYELIVRRFISCFCEDAKVENKTITAEINNLKFKARGLGIKEKAWMEVYTTKMQEKEIKDMNGKALIEKVKINEEETKPPKRYSPASIVSELEKRELGTKATRANIIETLYDRNYITDNRSIKATSLGMSLIDTMDKHSKIIIDEKLTRDMEHDTDSMQNSKNVEDLKSKEKIILDKARQILIKLSANLKKEEAEIGKELVNATQDFWQQQKKDNELSECPVCKKGNLVIKYSPKFRRSFIACSAYPECKTTFGLPPNGTIKKLDKKCDKCGFPLLMSLKKGKRPWIFCFNPNCPSRQNKEAPSISKESEEEKEEADEKAEENESSEE